MNIHQVKSVNGITNAYTKRILSNIINQPPLKIYARTPDDLKRFTRGLTKKELHTPPSKGKWSIATIISHLCDAEWAMGYRVRKVIAEPKSWIQAYDQDKWAEHLHYDKMDFREKLNLFTALRQSHLSLLKVLSAKEMQQYGIHEERGKETVERMIHMIAGHDVNHLRQIETIRKKFLAKKL